MKSSQQRRGEVFHNQIRKKAHEKMFKVMRHRIENLNSQKAQEICTNNFCRLENILNSHSDFVNGNSQEISILLKQIKDVSQSWLAPHVFVKESNLSLILNLQKQIYDIPLDSICHSFVYTILLNTSAYQQGKGQLSIKRLSLTDLQSSNAQFINQLLMICSNLLIKDNTSSTTYYLINNQCVNILRALIDLLSNKELIYNTIETDFLWFSRHIIERILIHQFDKMAPELFQQFSFIIYEKIQNNILDKLKHQPNNKNSSISLNEYYIVLKILLKCKHITFSHKLLQAFETQRLFDPKNIYFAQLLTAITCYSCYYIKREHTQLILELIFMDIKDPLTAVLLRVISNSLINNNESWKLVLNRFIHETESNSYNQLVDRASFPHTCFFVYFINTPSCQYNVVKIIEAIICSQGNLGVFQECLEEISISYQGAKILQSFGIQEINDQDFT